MKQQIQQSSDLEELEVSQLMQKAIEISRAFKQLVRLERNGKRVPSAEFSLVLSGEKILLQNPRRNVFHKTR